MHVQIIPGEGDTLVAVVDGTKLPIETYGAEPSEDGRALVSLVVAADEVSVSRSPTAPPASAPAVQKKPKQPRGVWGDPNISDPRESIPGWNPASESSTAGHDHTLAKWTCGCDPMLVGLQEAASRRGNIDVRTVRA